MPPCIFTSVQQPLVGHDPCEQCVEASPVGIRLVPTPIEFFPAISGVGERVELRLVGVALGLIILACARILCQQVLLSPKLVLKRFLLLELLFLLVIVCEARIERGDAPPQLVSLALVLLLHAYFFPGGLELRHHVSLLAFERRELRDRLQAAWRAR